MLPLPNTPTRVPARPLGLASASVRPLPTLAPAPPDTSWLCAPSCPDDRTIAVTPAPTPVLPRVSMTGASSSKSSSSAPSPMEVSIPSARSAAARASAAACSAAAAAARCATTASSSAPSKATWIRLLSRTVVGGGDCSSVAAGVPFAGGAVKSSKDRGEATAAARTRAARPDAASADEVSKTLGDGILSAFSRDVTHLTYLNWKGLNLRSSKSATTSGPIHSSCDFANSMVLMATWCANTTGKRWRRRSLDHMASMTSKTSRTREAVST
mmetsp:Transcript_25398/g.71432  ORF Transcript_25398/g.71432 Transcript_25398/m.71432 type:complete len:270 (+) Transcript_25398:191-1000(+)